MQARGRTHFPALHLASLFLPMMYPTLSALPWPYSVPSVMFSPLSAPWIALVIHFPIEHLLSNSVGPTPGHDSDCYSVPLTYTPTAATSNALALLRNLEWLPHGSSHQLPTVSMEPKLWAWLQACPLFLRFSSSWAGKPEMSEYLTIKYQTQIWKIIIMTTTIVGVLNISYILPHLTNTPTKNS